MLLWASDQKADLRDYLTLLSIESGVLAQAVNTWFFSQPEFVPDERGARRGVHTDSYISGSVFGSVHNAVKAVATWDYIGRLLGLLESPSLDKGYRIIVVQELSNACHLEFKRTQSMFKRHVQIGIGSKCFKRLSSLTDDTGNARVNMKVEPGKFIRDDPQLHYVLRLCSKDVAPSAVLDPMKKLSDLHRDHPMDHEKLTDREQDSLVDMGVIIGFMDELSQMVPLPPLSYKNQTGFVFRSQQLGKELHGLESQVDLTRFVIPIDNLLEPGVAKSTLAALDRFVVEKTGTTMGLLYQDMVEDCLGSLEEQFQRQKDQDAQRQTLSQGSTPTLRPPTHALPQPELERVEWRRQKEKTRPANSTAYGFAQGEDIPAKENPAILAQSFKVNLATAEVFTTFFRKSLSRGSVSWAAFEAAMADLNFSMKPKSGSIYTFYPPEAMAITRPITLHRPHQAKIEGHLITLFARRLTRVYGWSEETFEHV